jgi:AraC-like DNA-binding protein/two-component sensor histidine kinase
MKKIPFRTILCAVSILVFRQADAMGFAAVTAHPFWSRWWFCASASVLAGAALLLLCNVLTRRARQTRQRKKEMLLASATRQIRNSLFLINSPIRELTMDKDLSPKARSYLELAMEQSERLSTALAGLVNSQEADLARQRLALSQVDIVKLVSLRCLLFESLGRGRNIAINFRCDHEAFVVAADRNKIGDAIDNLISNALKHSWDGGEVWVELQCFRGEWLLQVRDAGTGREERIRSFHKPHPASGGTKRKMPEPDPGPILAREMVKLHRGKIACESDEGGGVNFRIVVPNHPQRIQKWRLGEFDRPMPLETTSIKEQKRHTGTSETNLLREDEMWRMLRTTQSALESVRKKMLENSAVVRPTQSTGADNKFLKKALEVIIDNMLDPRFGKAEFASAVGVSPSLLYKKLKVQTGLSPTDFIKTVKLNYAMELLIRRRYGVTEVSELCGFSSVSYFSTVFRTHFGKSPSAV